MLGHLLGFDFLPTAFLWTRRVLVLAANFGVFVEVFVLQLFWTGTAIEHDLIQAVQREAIHMLIGSVGRPALRALFLSLKPLRHAVFTVELVTLRTLLHLWIHNTQANRAAEMVLEWLVHSLISREFYLLCR